MLNRIYIVVGLLAILALASAFIVPPFIHWGDYRDRMEVLAESVFGTDVHIRGDIDFTLLPEPRLSFADVVVGAEDAPVATVDSIEARFALLDFLRDRYNLSALVLKSPSIALELDENGLLVSGVDLSGAGQGVALEQARIEEGEINLIDRRSGDSYSLSEVNGDLRLGSFAGPFQFQGNAIYDGEAYALRLNSGVVDEAGSSRVSAFIADASGSSSFTLDGAMQTGPAPKFDGTVVLRQSPPAAARAEQIRGNLVFESKIAASTDRIVLNGYTLVPDENRAGVRLTGAASVQLGARNSFEAVVSGGVFNLPPRDAEEDASQMPYELVRLLGELPAPPIPPIPGQIGVDLAEIGLRGAGLRNVRIDATTNGMIWTLTRAEADLPGNSKLTLSGSLRNDGGLLGFNGNVELTTTRLDALSQLWRRAREDSPLFNVPAQLSGQLMLAGDALGFSHGLLSLNGKTHAVEARLGFGEEPRLDLVGRLDALAPGDSAILSAIFPDPASDAAFGVSFPQGSFSLRSQAIRVVGLEAADFQAEGNWSSSGLRFSRLVSSDWGGIALNASGQLRGTLAAPVITGAGRFEVDRSDAPALARLYSFLGVPAVWQTGFSQSLPAALEVELSEGDTAEAQLLTLRGDLAGSRLDLSLDMAGGLSGLGADRVRVIGSLETDDTAGLMRQLGLPETAPFAASGEALLSLFAEGSAETRFDTRLSLSQSGELAAYSGELFLLPSGELTGTGMIELSLTDGSGMADLVGGTGIGLGGFEATGSLDFYGLQSIAVTSLVGETDAAAFSGEVSIERVAQRPSIQGALEFDTLPIEGLAAALFSPAALVAGGGSWPDGPLASSTSPRSTRGSIAVTAREIDFGEARLDDAGFTLNWDQQTLAIADLSGSIGGGRLTGTLSQCCSGPLLDRTLTGRLTLEDVAVDALAPTAMSGVSGSVSGSASFEGTGASLSDIAASLAGEGNLTLSDLRIPRLSPEVYPTVSALDDVLNMDTDVLTILIDQALTQGDFAAPTATGAFRIAGGTLRLSNLLVDGGGARLAGGVNLAFPTLGLDGLFVLTPRGFADPSGLIEGENARVLARLTGTLAAPQLSIDTSEMVAAVQVRANELEVDRLEALQLEDEARQRAAAEERNRLIAEQQRRAAEEAAARAAAEEAARQAAEQQAPPVLGPLEPAPPANPVAPSGTPLDLTYPPPFNVFGGEPVNVPR